MSDTYGDVTKNSVNEMLDQVTKRAAKYRVKNETGKKIKFVTVYHKYSDNYHNSETWKNVAVNACTGEATATYNTGAFTTGRDWWLLVWMDENNELYFTAPNNFREIFDGLEEVGNNIIGAMREALERKDIRDDENQMYGIMAACTLIFSPLLNSEKTAGFKQHILREEDQKSTTTIVLRPINHKDPVEFYSKSGNSITVYKKANTDKLKKEIDKIIKSFK